MSSQHIRSLEAAIARVATIRTFGRVRIPVALEVFAAFIVFEADGALMSERVRLHDCILFPSRHGEEWTMDSDFSKVCFDG